MTKQKTRNILFDCERMKYPHTGLYHFCLQLGNALIRNSDPGLEKISFYIPASAGKVFGENANYVTQKKMHKFWMPSLKDFHIWHSTNHDSYHNAVIGKLKNVLTVHDLNFLYEHSNRPEKIKRSLYNLQKQLDRADSICTISEYVKSDLLKNVNLMNKPVTVIYNGCNKAPLQEITAPAFLPVQPFLFTIGTITEKKKFHVLPALLCNNNMLLLIGGITVQPKYAAKIMEEAGKYGVQDRVIFTGALSENDKAWYLKNCEAFVFPSIAEGFGLPVIEAMAYGKPVFASTATSLPEIGGEAAFYFNSFDAAEMQQTFKKGMELYNTLKPVEEIKQRAASFNWDVAALKYLQVYRSLY